MQTFARAMKKQILTASLQSSGVVSVGCAKLLRSLEPALNFETKKALLIFYCLSQFKNAKATSFNILYYIAAALFIHLWAPQPCFLAALNSLILILKTNQDARTLRW
jgi:hypothetical protein